MYRRLIICTAVAGITLLAINTLASALYWYDAIWWFDMGMHALGGVFVALLGGSLVVRQLRVLTGRESLIVILLLVFIIGLGWEYYEYIVQYYVKGVQLAHVSDSISDLICDMIGGSVGALFVILLKKRYNHS